jgi:glycosyltransferase involved in cell wall biosynthesis
MTASPNDGLMHPRRGASGPVLVIWPSVAASRIDGQIWFDRKFKDGMDACCASWPGRVRALMHVQDVASLPPFGAWRWNPDEASFDLETLEPGQLLTEAHLAGVAVLQASADDHRQLDAAALCERTGTVCIYAIELTLRTRLGLTRYSDAPVLRKLKAAVWHLRNELRVSKAIRRAHGLQGNGLPAWLAYRHSTPSPLLYFDTRLRKASVVTPAELEGRLAVLRAREPLRMAFSGRLVEQKGADALVPLALRLRQLAVAFTLDIYGTGDLNDRIRAEIAAHGLADCVRLHGAVDFDQVLMPRLKDGVDVFVCCHRQGDPSCTYAETLGCGVPIVGFANEALASLVSAHGIGWSVPMGDVAGLATLVARLAADRDDIAAKSLTAMRFGQEHHFESVVDLRMKHCAMALPHEAGATPPIHLQNPAT